MMYDKKLKEIGYHLSNGGNIGNYWRNVKLKELLLKETDFLVGVNTNIERMYYIINDLREQQRCVCSKLTSVKRVKGYYIVQSCSRHCAMSVIGNDGLTGYERIGKKTKDAMEVVGDDGLTGYERNSVKISKTLNSVQESGKTRGQELGELSAIARTVVDVSSGLTINQKNGKKVSKTLMAIQPSGKTRGKELGELARKVRIVEDDNGLNGYQRSALMMSKTVKKQKYYEHKDKIESLGFTVLSSLSEYYKDVYFRYKCNTCNQQNYTRYRNLRCLKCNPYNKSIAEQEIIDYCDSYVLVKSNARNIISPLELDVYVESLNLAIEYNGLFWHNHNKLENKNYHLNKTELCEAKGIHLLHIFENEWLDPTKQNIWKSIISNKLGHSTRLYARNCGIRTVSSVEKCEFLKANHLQGDCPSSVNVGLYHNDELVSLMTFGKSRFSKKYDWELLRFCNTLNVSVVGGASRLLKRFRALNDGSIVSYADKRRSNGNLYKQLGFSHSHDSKPNYWYFKSGDIMLESRVKYQKHKLSKILKYFDSDLSESDNMNNNGYHKIYDCGNQVWVL